MKEGDRGVRDRSTSTLQAGLHAKWSTQSRGVGTKESRVINMVVALTEKVREARKHVPI